MSAVRRDAQSNRARILQVAEEVFGRGGEAASTEEVARLAGVGIATVFRHFPTKAALLEAVLLERFGRLKARADALASADDAGEAFFAYFRHMVEDSATKITIGEALIGTGALSEGDESPIDRAAADLRDALGVLLARPEGRGRAGRRRPARGLRAADRRLAIGLLRPPGTRGAGPQSRDHLRRPPRVSGSRLAPVS